MIHALFSFFRSLFKTVIDPFCASFKFFNDSDDRVSSRENRRFYLLQYINVFVGCGKDQFQCMNGDCIRADQQCNSFIDCADGSDEDCSKISRCSWLQIRLGKKAKITNFCNNY